MQEFDKLSLHDAILETIEINWANSIVVLNLKAFVVNGKNAIPSKLEFNAVTNLVIPHKSEWGNSSSINSVRISNNQYTIEMQSGDILTIEAESFSFESNDL